MPVEVDTVRAVSVPTRLVHGPGAVSSLASETDALGITRPMLVTDPGVVAAGLVDRVLPHLDGAVVFDEVRPNPDIELVDRAAEAYREAGCDGLVALGGGSSLDTAKSIGVVAVHGGSIARYEWGRDPIEPANPLARRDPHDRGDRQRGDALGRHHRSRPPPEVQCRRHAADRRARRPDRPGADARPAPGGHRRDGDGCALARDRVLHVRLPPALQRRGRAARDRARCALVAHRGRGRRESRGAHADGARSDARRDGLRNGERRGGPCDEPVRGRRPRLPARCAHGPGARPSL